jgi:protein phosphatase
MAAPLEIRVPDPCLVLLVGAAGAGKSTFATRHFAPDEVLSSDAFREATAGDAADQRATGPAFAALHRALDRRLDERLLTVVDATNVQARARAVLLRRAAAAHVPVVAIVLDLPRDVVLRRNAARRSRVVPEPAVRRQLHDLDRSLATGALEREGLVAVVRLQDPATVDSCRILRVPASGRA